MKNRIFKFIKRRFCVFFGTIVLAIILIGSLSDIQYDSGVLGLLFHFFIVPVLGFPFYLPNEILFNFNDGHSFPGQFYIAILIGYVFLFLSDFLILKICKKVKQKWNGL